MENKNLKQEKKVPEKKKGTAEEVTVEEKVFSVYENREQQALIDLNEKIKEYVDDFPHAGSLSEAHMKYVITYITPFLKDLINVHSVHRKTK